MGAGGQSTEVTFALVDQATPGLIPSISKICIINFSLGNRDIAEVNSHQNTANKEDNESLIVNQTHLVLASGRLVAG